MPAGCCPGSDCARRSPPSRSRREENCFFNRHGQLIWKEPCGLAAGYDWPQFSIHRADLHAVLLDAARRELGDDRVILGHRCAGFDQDDNGVTVHFDDPVTGEALEPVRGTIAVGCDGFHSVLRKQLHPDEGPPHYGGINVWRGVTRWPAYLTGASMARAGSLKLGKIVIYPIRDNIDDQGRQLVNWATEIESDTRKANDWNTPGRIEDFFDHFAHMHFDWLDVAAMIEAADMILEYPMVDRDPVDVWSVGRVTLLGDAAHPMYPRGSNGAAQAILDADLLSRLLVEGLDGGRRAGRDPPGVRGRAAAGDGGDRAHQPEHAARHGHQPGRRAHRRRALRPARGRDLRRGAGADQRHLQARDRLFEGRAEAAGSGLMAGFEEEYVLGEATWRQRRARDWRLFRHIARVFWMWCTVGRKLRRAYREADRTGQPVIIDHLKRGRV